MVPENCVLVLMKRGKSKIHPAIQKTGASREQIGSGKAPAKFSTKTANFEEKKPSKPFWGHFGVKI